MLGTCGACRFLGSGPVVNADSYSVAECRRYPPMPVILTVPGDVRFGTVFPEVTDNDWRGEYDQGPSIVEM